MATDIRIDWKPIIQEWKSLGHGEKGDWYRQLRDRLFPKKTVKATKAKFHRERRDYTGKLKESPKETDARKMEICKIIMEMKERGKQRSDDPREWASWRCINYLERRGIIEKDEISASHVNTILRDKLAYREETPRVRWEVDRGLAEVQTDGSTSKFYRPVKRMDDGDTLLKASGRPLRYKGRNAEATKVILWQWQDKYSRLRIARGFPGKAENTGVVLRALHFWLNRPQDEHPMRHLPWSFGHDNGSVFKTDEWENILKAFDLDPNKTEDNRLSKPYEKTGIGSAERMWQPIWQFELELSEDYDQLMLSEYNMLLHERMIQEMEMEHPVFAGKRGDLFQKSLLRQQPTPRVLKADVFELAHKRYERTVTTELNISIDNVKYAVPQYWAGRSTIGEKVIAWENWRGDLVAELRDRYSAETFALEPFEYQMKGEYRSHKRTTQQRLKDGIDSGESKYKGVMNGNFKINSDGEYVDQQTGEVLTPGDSGKPQRLMPADEEHRPDTPFSRTDSEEKAGAGQFESAFKARAWIGKQLQSYGATYADVKGHFDPIIEEGLDRGVIADAVDGLIREINSQSKVG